MADTSEDSRPDSTSAGGDTADATNDSSNSSPQGGGMQAVIAHINSDKVEAAMWISRIVTILFTISFVLPLFGLTQYTSGQRVLIAGAITSALRLHQRMPQIRLNREFIGLLFSEDSAHYLVYSILMLYTTSPVSICLMPVFLFALLHVTKYTKTLLNLMGAGSFGMIRNLITKIDTNQRMMLKLIATVEISLMPTTLFLILGGQAALLLPFGYYRFLCMRYTSVRNPYCRTVFYELRLLAEHLTTHPRCPAFAVPLIHKVIAFTGRMAPVSYTPPPPAQ